MHERGSRKGLNSILLTEVRLMSVSRKDREDYEKGIEDSKKGALDQVLTDVPVRHPGTDAYYKGRRGEQLDEDKDK